MGKRRTIKFGAETLKNMDLSNPVFEEYYRKQLSLDESDFELLLQALKTELPVTFRTTGFRQQNRELLSLLRENYLQSIINKSVTDSAGDVTVVPLRWYPGLTAWQINASRLTIRKSSELKELQKFLVSESEAGNLSRQEAVSMLPPLVLDIKEHHAVLDLCAAPGSKSAQLVELLHADAESKCSDATHYSEPSGIVVANDLDRQRCYMMVHQVKRLQSPCVILTEEDASVYPRLFINSSENPDMMQQMLFDRILADVPCSGDGTLRKSPDIWARWTPKIGRGHHDLQKRILRRGLELLRVPESPDDHDLPRLVYSTCSLNPVEDEAVVASVLAACKGTVRLVEPDLLCLPNSTNAKDGGFIARQGLKSWQILMGNDKWYTAHSELPERERGTVQTSLFPPENAEELHLEHCRRVLPHDQNTGGFFIAVFEKLTDLPWMRNRQRITKGNCESSNNVASTERSVIETEVSANCNAPASKKARLTEYRREESSFVYMDPATDNDWPKIREYYGIEKGGKTLAILNPAQILYRASCTDDPIRRRFLYYTNALVKKVIQANVGTGLHIVSGGVKLFALSDDKQFVGYRLLHDGVHLASAFLPQSTSMEQYPPQLCYRRLSLSASERDDLVLLLCEEMPLAERFSRATQDQWEKLDVGPVLIDYNPFAASDPLNPPDKSLRPHCRIAFAGWRGAKSLRHYIDRHERVHILRLCGLDASVPLITGRAKDLNQGDKP
ncbi:unnamed protein product [Mesocestoides corti]|nr:unnamed protein product [Mesocestoides corti]